MANEWTFLTAGIALAFTGLLVLARSLRARNTSRWLSTLDDYAEREILRHAALLQNSLHTNRSVRIRRARTFA